jgi:outer membrane translocation and assembly module TamA
MRRLKVGRPRDRQVVLSTHEMAVNQLRDYGYPYAQVATERKRSGAQAGDARLQGWSGTLAHFGPVEVTGEKSVSENIIRRELDYSPAICTAAACCRTRSAACTGWNCSSS